MKEIKKKINPKNYICFSDRLQLETAFKKYCKTNRIPTTNFALITFLQINELLNRANVKNLLKKRRNKMEKEKLQNMITELANIISNILNENDIQLTERYVEEWNNVLDKYDYESEE